MEHVFAGNRATGLAYVGPLEDDVRCVVAVGVVLQIVFVRRPVSRPVAIVTRKVGWKDGDRGWILRDPLR